MVLVWGDVVTTIIPLAVTKYREEILDIARRKRAVFADAEHRAIVVHYAVTTPWGIDLGI